MQTSSNFQLLRPLRLFEKCSDDFVRALAKAGQVKSANSGCVLLTQGRENSELAILLSGQVDVRVDDESVAVMSEAGDPMGEISVLLGRKASASVIAQTEVQYFAIGMKDLETSVLGTSAVFGYELYRAFAEVLAGKIVRTNDKARRFELANRTLDLKVSERTRDLLKKTDELETRNGELLASHRKLEELYSTKEITFKKLQELQLAYLEPLMKVLRGLETNAESSALVQIEKAKSQIAGSISMLRPFSELYSTERAMRSRHVLLVEQDRKQQSLAKMALGGTGVRLDVAGSHEEGLSFLNTDDKYDLAFVSSAVADLIPEIQKASPGTQIVFMASTNIPTELPILKKYGSEIFNLVSRHPDDRTFTVKNVATTTGKLVTGDVFGLEKYMLWGVEVQSQSVSASDQRGGLIGAMREHFTKLGVRSTISDRVAMVAEELLMNAIYDAPTSKNGQSRYNHTDRKELVRLEDSEHATFRYACDGMLAAISVSDPFGRFRLRTLIDYLERNYGGADCPQDDGKAGAGRGLHQIVEGSDLVVFNVKRNIRTEVIALFHLDSKASIEGTKPSFHFCLE